MERCRFYYQKKVNHSIEYDFEHFSALKVLEINSGGYTKLRIRSIYTTLTKHIYKDLFLSQLKAILRLNLTL